MSEIAYDPRSTDSPVFIVGLPRSGTTLMQSLLSAHPRIAIAPETHFLNQFVAETDGERLEEDSFERFWRRFAKSERFQAQGLDEDVVRNAIVRSADYSYANIFRTVLQEYANKQQKERFGEKTPYHLAHLSQLFAWFPTARVLYMIRDPRAVCASLMEVPWREWERKGLRSLEPRAMTRLRRVYHDATVWRSQVESFEKKWNRDPRVKVILYEDLVRKPEASLREVCDFLDESFYAGMMKARSQQRLVPPPAAPEGGKRREWREAHQEKAKERVFTKSIEKWKSTLSRMEVYVIESICDSEMGRLGFPIGRKESIGLAIHVKGELGKAWGSTYWRFSRESYRVD